MPPVKTYTFYIFHCRIMSFITEKLTESYFTLLYALFLTYPMSLEHQYLKMWTVSILCNSKAATVLE